MKFLSEDKKIFEAYVNPGKDPLKHFFAFAPDYLNLFRNQVFRDAKYPTSKSHDILWRPTPGDQIKVLKRHPNYPKEDTFKLDIFYKAKTIPLKGPYSTFSLAGGSSPQIELDVLEGPYKNEPHIATNYYGIFPVGYDIRSNLSDDTLETFNDILS